MEFESVLGTVIVASDILPHVLKEGQRLLKGGEGVVKVVQVVMCLSQEEPDLCLHLDLSLCLLISSGGILLPHQSQSLLQ